MYEPNYSFEYTNFNTGWGYYGDCGDCIQTYSTPHGLLSDAIVYSYTGETVIEENDTTSFNVFNQHTFSFKIFHPELLPT